MYDILNPGPPTAAATRYRITFSVRQQASDTVQWGLALSAAMTN